MLAIEANMKYVFREVQRQGSNPEITLFTRTSIKAVLAEARQSFTADMIDTRTNLSDSTTLVLNESLHVQHVQEKLAEYVVDLQALDFKLKGVIRHMQGSKYIGHIQDKKFDDHRKLTISDLIDYRLKWNI